MINVPVSGNHLGQECTEEDSANIGRFKRKHRPLHAICALDNHGKYGHKLSMGNACEVIVTVKNAFILLLEHDED